MILFDERVFNNRRMKTIKIFLASSDELKSDRISFGNFVRQLDNLYEKRGIRIKLFEWEDTDAAYNGGRKQDEYNDEVRSSDIFLALFKTKAGCFTIEEFSIAKEEQDKKDSPVIYVFCKALKPDEKETKELTEFKRTLQEELGHYPSTFTNEDSLQKEFVFQLLHYENRQLEELKLENGVIYLESLRVADMSNLQFAKGNPDYQKLSNVLDELYIKIDQARSSHEANPDDEDLSRALQDLLDKYQHNKSEFEMLQRALFDQSKRLSEIQMERISQKRQQAMSAFEEGSIGKTNDIYDEIHQEAVAHFEQFKQNQESVHQYVDAARDQVNAVLADTRLSVEQRILKAKSVYETAEKYARLSSYDEGKYIQLLKEFLNFLMYYGLHSDAELVGDTLLKRLSYSDNSNFRDVINVNNRLGLVLYRLGMFDEAISRFKKAKELIEQFGDNNLDAMSSVYNNMGLVYQDMHLFSEAIECYKRAIDLHSQLPHPEEGTLECRFWYDSLAAPYLNLGQVYEAVGDVEKGLSYQFMSAVFRTEKRHFGPNDPSTALGYSTFGHYYSSQPHLDLNLALENYLMALDIQDRVLGPMNLKTIDTYINVAQTYRLLNNQDKYKHYLYLAERSLTAIGALHSKQYVDVLFCKAMENWHAKHYDRSLDYLKHGIQITETLPGKNGLSTLQDAFRLISKESKLSEAPNAEDKITVDKLITESMSFLQNKDYDKCLELLYMAKSMAEEQSYHAGLETCLKLLCQVFVNKGGDYRKTKDALVTCLSYLVERYGPDSPSLIVILSEMGHLHYDNKEYEEALDYFEGTLEIQEKYYGTINEQTATSHVNLAGVQEELRDYSSAVYHYDKALSYYRSTNNTSLLQIIGSRRDIAYAMIWAENNLEGKRKK